LEHTVDSTLYGYLFYPTKISNNETKYVFLDTVKNQFSLYNLDFTPFLTNISVPHRLRYGDPNNTGFYSIMYITRTLFDCDSTNIEYLFADQSDLYEPLWIMRTDGTILFYADTMAGIYCLGCPGGTTLLRPILKTESGTKLVLMKTYASSSGARNFSIYSLCGTLPDDVYDFSSEQATYVKIFPNPSSMLLNFEINLPDNLNDYEFIIINNNSQVLRKQKIGVSDHSFSLDVKEYSSGTYYYSLASKIKVLQSGKFIITK
jgi:hypothetical protein